MKLLLIDDHKLMLDGLSQVLLANLPGALVLIADDVKSAKKHIAEHPDIDLVLVDLSMPETDGIAFLEEISVSPLAIPVAVLSASEDAIQIKRALALDAVGFIPKSYSTPELINAIKDIVDGRLHLPTNLRTFLDESLAAIQNADLSSGLDITDRQLQVLRYIADGLANSQIAEAMFISEHTVKSHVKQLFQKLEVNNRIACVNKAKELAII